MLHLTNFCNISQSFFCVCRFLYQFILLLLLISHHYICSNFWHPSFGLRLPLSQPVVSQYYYSYCFQTVSLALFYILFQINKVIEKAYVVLLLLISPAAASLLVWLKQGFWACPVAYEKQAFLVMNFLLLGANGEYLQKNVV